MKILVINAGSSSLKYQLINMEDESVIAKGNCDRIGIDGHIKHTTFDGRTVEADRLRNPVRNSLPRSRRECAVRYYRCR